MTKLHLNAFFSTAVLTTMLLSGCAAATDTTANGLCLSGSTTVMINAEVAADDRSRARGLMQRDSLGSHEGMLFYYPDTQYRGFWMYQTLIPLDIAFLADNGEIVDIQTMEPCLSNSPRQCPGYQSSAPARAALELNAGAFEQFSIQVGDYVYEQSCSREPWHDW